MSAVLESEKPGSERTTESKAVEIREGDWKAYLESVARYGKGDSLAARYGTLVEYKRACAMAYLGRRAQLHGGVCSTRHPHIMTAQFVLDLEANNRATRFTRYPWLRALMHLLCEIEQIQDQIASTNVITLVPAAK